jgi:ribulose-phosphate 3-epimerase
MALVHELLEGAPHLSVGVISANIMRLGDNVRTLADSGCRLLHFDVMDGCFCPQLTAGPFFIKGIKTTLYKDVHLMVADPLPLIPECAAAGADIITVHIESGRHVHRALQLIGEQTNANMADRGIVRGIALNPGTPLSALEPLLDAVDIVFLLAVNPGFPKQRFIAATAKRFEELKTMIAGHSGEPLLAIDGGITRENASVAAALGPHIIVTGSAIFEGGKIGENFTAMQRSIGTGKG